MLSSWYRVVVVSSPHLQLLTFTPYQFLTQRKEIFWTWRIWMVLLAWADCMVWCAKCSQLSFAASLLGNTWDHVTYPSQDVSSHLCCCCAVTEKCCHLEEHIFASRLKSFLWVYVNDFSKYLCVCRWRGLPEQEAEEYVLRHCVWKISQGLTRSGDKWPVHTYILIKGVEINADCDLMPQLDAVFGENQFYL